MTRRARFGVGWSLLIVVAAAAVWAYPRPLRDLSPGERIEVLVKGPAQADSFLWQREGDVYQSGDRRITMSDIVYLRRLILASQEPCDPLNEVGFLAKEDYLVKGVRQRHPWLTGDPPHVDLDAAARQAAKQTPTVPSQIRFEINLGGKPEIRLTGATSVDPLSSCFPTWTVEAGNVHWQTRHPMMSYFLRELCPATRDGEQHPLDTSDWNQRFYDQQIDRLAETWGRESLYAASKFWPGYEELNATITEFVSRFDSNWAVSLERDDRVIHQAVIAFDPNQGLDWGQVKIELKDATEALAQQPWVKLPVRLTPCEDFGRQSWAAAKLEGEPAFGFEGNGQDFLLSRDGQVCLADCSAAEAIQTFGLSIEPSNAWYKVIIDHGKARLAPRDPYVHEIESVKIE